MSGFVRRAKARRWRSPAGARIRGRRHAALEGGSGGWRDRGSGWRTWRARVRCGLARAGQTKTPCLSARGSGSFDLGFRIRYTNPIPAPDWTVIRSTRRRRAEVSASGRRVSRAPGRAEIAVCGWLLRCVMGREKHGLAQCVNSYFDNVLSGRLRCRCRNSFSAAASHWRSPRALPAARCRPPSRQAAYSTGSM